MVRGLHEPAQKPLVLAVRDLVLGADDRVFSG
jgi:hypothetical protein